MAKRKVRTKATSKSTMINWKPIFTVFGITIGTYIIYLLATSIDFESTIEKPKNISLDTVKIDTITTLTEKKNLRKIQVEILNGCGISNITSEFRDFFKRNDVDIIAVGNYVDFKQKNSFIIYHSYDVKKRAEELADKLNIPIKQIKEDIYKKPVKELTLVLGLDYSQLNRN